MPDAFAFGLNFVHPLVMAVLGALSLYALYLGIKAKRTRLAEPEQRKELIKGRFAQRHYKVGSLVLVLTVLGSFGGMAVTYFNNGKLFVAPHLLVGLGIASLLVLAVALVPLIQQGNLVARKVHVGLNMTALTLFLWQAFTGLEIVGRILNPPAA
jgi:FtsH-binding integral membrane protein